MSTALTPGRDLIGVPPPQWLSPSPGSGSSKAVTSPPATSPRTSATVGRVTRRAGSAFADNLGHEPRRTSGSCPQEPSPGQGLPASVNLDQHGEAPSSSTAAPARMPRCGLAVSAPRRRPRPSHDSPVPDEVSQPRSGCTGRTATNQEHHRRRTDEPTCQTCPCCPEA